MILTFGKYKGQTIAEVIVKDPSYFVWCKYNVNGFRFSEKDSQIHQYIKSQRMKRIRWVDQFKAKYEVLADAKKKLQEGFFDKYNDEPILKADPMRIFNYIKA